MIPSCVPSWPMTRTSRARIFSLTLSFFSMVCYLPPPSTRGLLFVFVSRARDATGVHLRQPVANRLQAQRPEVPFAAAAQRDGARLRLAVPRDQHEGDLHELRVADLGSDLLVTVVEVAAQASRLQ